MFFLKTVSYLLMQRIVLLIISLWFCTHGNNLSAQNIERARQHINQLCSEDFAGRGYTKDGHNKAANFIEAQFKTYGAKPLPDKNYQQKFLIDVNTFPKKVELKINGKKLTTGKDYIIDPSSPGGKGKTKIAFIDTTALRSEKGLKQIEEISKKRKALFFNNIGEQDYKSTIFAIKSAEQPKVLFEKTDDKLTWHISPSLGKTIHFKIDAKALPEKIKKVEYEIEHHFKKDVETQNVISWVEGTTYPDSVFLFTAHYDHIGEMGNEHYIAGANDNASGTALLLNLAAHYAKNPAPYTTVFIAFGGEELGLLGSKHFVESWWLDLDKIKFQVNLDIVGGGSEGVQIVNSRIFTKAYDLMNSINTDKQYLKQLKLRGSAYNSDHAPFFEKEVPCFFIYTLGGPPHYHDVFDRPETLPLTEYEDLFRLIVDFVSEAEGIDLGVRE